MHRLLFRRHYQLLINCVTGDGPENVNTPSTISRGEDYQPNLFTEKKISIRVENVKLIHVAPKKGHVPRDILKESRSYFRIRPQHI